MCLRVFASGIGATTNGLELTTTSFGVERAAPPSPALCLAKPFMLALPAHHTSVFAQNARVLIPARPGVVIILPVISFALGLVDRLLEAWSSWATQHRAIMLYLAAAPCNWPAVQKLAPEIE